MPYTRLNFYELFEHLTESSCLIISMYLAFKKMMMMMMMMMQINQTRYKTL